MAIMDSASLLYGMDGFIVYKPEIPFFDQNVFKVGSYLNGAFDGHQDFCYVFMPVDGILLKGLNSNGKGHMVFELDNFFFSSLHLPYPLHYNILKEFWVEMKKGSLSIVGVGFS